MLHGDIACRPYRIEDLRQPLREAGVLGEVVKIEAYQMLHIFLLDLGTSAAKQNPFDAGRLAVKDRKCLVFDPQWQEIRITLHCVSLGVTKGVDQRVVSDYGELKELRH